ncbi:uncharacterized protein METZ01_LOCUS18666 [marine metagenome]|uniref:Uncharacterized protein n=1 Tax=marine metagenome TaxID=408172 RepID=A0A381PFR2_9ZZZZ
MSKPIIGSLSSNFSFIAEFKSGFKKTNSVAFSSIGEYWE